MYGEKSCFLNLQQINKAEEYWHLLICATDLKMIDSSKLERLKFAQFQLKVGCSE